MFTKLLWLSRKNKNVIWKIGDHEKLARVSASEPLPVWREIGMGFSLMSGEATNEGKTNFSQVTNGTFPIPHEWLSRRDEIKIPHERRSRECKEL